MSVSTTTKINSGDVDNAVKYPLLMGTTRYGKKIFARRRMNKFTLQIESGQQPSEFDGVFDWATLKSVLSTYLEEKGGEEHEDGFPEVDLK